MLRLAGDDGDASGERLLRKLKAVSAPVVDAAEGRKPAPQHVEAVGHGDVNVRRKLISSVTVHGEPAARVEQIAALGVDVRQVQAFDRRVFDSSDLAVVGEGRGVGLVHRQYLWERQAQRKVLAVSQRLKRYTVGPGHVRHVQPVVKLKDGLGGLLPRNEGHLRRGFERMGWRIDASFDVVALDVDQRPIGLRFGQRRQREHQNRCR